METTLVLLKPDAVQRRLVGRILARFENKGLRIVAMKMLSVSRDQAAEMYAEHKGQEFCEPLMDFITASPVVAAVLGGKDAVSVVRKMLGATFGPDAAPGTIRGDFAMSRRYNLIHGSDSAASAQREIELLFRPDELGQYDLADEVWVYARRGGELL